MISGSADKGEPPLNDSGVFLVPEVGFEPTRPGRPPVPETGASANFTTPA